MATLNQLTLDADGTIGSGIRHNNGSTPPFYTHCDEAPDGVSTNFVRNADDTTDTAWFSLSDMNTGFGSMDTLSMDVDIIANVAFADDTCTLTARIYDADNDTTNALTAESGNLATEADTTRTQRNITFASLAGTEAQWNAAHIRLSWTYTQNGGADGGNLRMYGCSFDGTYTGSGGGSLVNRDSLGTLVNGGLVS